MARNGQFSVKVTDYDTLVFDWSIKNQNIAGNYSVIEWEFKLVATAYGAINSSVSKKWNATINGTDYTGTNRINIGNNSTITLASGQSTINHNADGTKTFSFSFYQDFSITFSNKYIGGVSGSAYGTLDRIARGAVLVSAPHFNDEENPTITYSNPAGSAVRSLRACISLTGAVDDIAYRDIPVNGSSYTFELTEAERNVLRNATKNSRNRLVTFYVTSDLGGEYYYSTLQKSLSIINADPTLSPTAIDVNSISAALTGDPSKIIKGCNTINYTFGAQAYKGATITKTELVCGNMRSTAASGTLTNVENKLLTFNVTDSRGNTALRQIIMPMVDYVPLTCSVDGNINISEIDTTKAELSFTISGNYYNGSFGAVDNTLTLAYTLEAGEAGGGMYYEQVEIPANQITNNHYSITLTRADLDYNNSYTVVAEVSDAIIKNLKSSSKVFKALPVFDWSETDFNFNVPISINNQPLDYIVEQGTSGYWEYRKWSSGKIELEAARLISSEPCNIDLGGWYRTQVLSSPAFPFTIDNPKVTINYESNGYGALIWATTLTTRTEPFDFYLIRPTSSAAISGKIIYHVSGYWTTD